VVVVADQRRWLQPMIAGETTLALAYAEHCPDHVTEMVLFGVTTGRRAEADWLFRGGVARFFPEQWDRLRAALPTTPKDADIVDAYNRLLFDPDPAIHERAAFEWCMWESATPAWPPLDGLAPRFKDPRFALAFARIVTHYVRHDAWIEDGALLRDAASLANIPGVLINGRFDFQSPIANAWELRRAWPGAELTIIDDAGHDAGNAAITQELIRATDQFAGHSA